MTAPGGGRDVIIRLLAQGSQEVVAAVRSVKDEIKSLSAVGASAPAATSFQSTATEAAALAGSLSTVTEAATAADRAVEASAQATTQLGAAQRETASQTTRLAGEARTAAADVANAVQLTVRALRTDLGTVIGQANLGEQARTAALDVASALETGLRDTVAHLRGQLAQGAIDPAAFKAQADAAIAAFGAEMRQQIAQLPPATLPIAVDTGHISTEAFQAAEEAFTQSTGVSGATRTLEELDQVLTQTATDFQTGKLTVAEFSAAVAAIRADAVASVGDASQLTGVELAKLNSILSQTEQLSTAGFSAILQAVQEAQVGLKSGALSAEQYGEALQAARDEAIALAQATGDLSSAQLSKFNTILSQTTARVTPATRGLGQLRSGMATVAAQSAGLTSGLGTIGNALLLISTGSVVATGILLAVGAAVSAYHFLTTATREAREEHDKLVQSLKGEAEAALPADVRAMKDLTAAAEAQTRAMKNLRTLRALGAEQPGVFAPIENELARRQEKALADAVEAGAVAQRHQREAVLETADALEKKLDIGLADTRDRAAAVTLAAQLRDRIKEQTTALQAQVLTAAGRKALEDERLKTEEAANALDASLRRDPVGDARRQAASQADQRELTQATSLNRSLEQINQQAFDRATQDLQAFFATRKKLIQENTETEVATILTASRRAASRPLQGSTDQELAADRITRESQAADLRAQANARLIQGEQQLRDLAEQERVAAKATADERLRGELQLIQARGQSLAQSLLEIDQQATRFREVLNLTPGLTTEQRDAQEAEFRHVLEVKAQADEVQRRVDLTFADLARARGAITDQVATGQLTEVEGNERIAALERARLPTLQALVDQMTAFARTLGDPALQSAAADLDARLRSMGAGADATVQRVAQLKDSLQRAFADLDRDKQAIQDQVTVGQITPDQGTERIAALERARLGNLREIEAELRRIALASNNPELLAFADDLDSRLTTLAADADLAGQRMAALQQSIEEAVTNDLADFFSRGIDEAKNFGDAMRSLALSIVQSIRQIVAQLLAAQIVKSIAGTLLGGGIPAAPGGLDSGTLASQAGSAPTFARGGAIRGPGTGTSDSILAWLSNGEYVLPASAVQYYGLDRLERLRLRQFPRFAEGGAVSAPAPSSGGPVAVTALAELMGHLQVSADEGAIVRVLKANFPILVQQHKRLLGQVAGGERR